MPRAVRITKPKAKKITVEEHNEIRRVNGRKNLGIMCYEKAEPQDCTEPNNEFDISELYSSRAQYTAQQKLEAVTAFVMTGTVMGAVRLTGIKHQLIYEWKNKSSWWPDAYRAVKVQKQEEMDGAMTAIIHVASEEVIDRLLHGDEVITKDGDTVRKKMTGKDSAWVLSIIHDKRALLRGDPTSRTEKIDQKQLIEDLAKKFEEMGSNAKVVSEQ